MTASTAPHDAFINGHWTSGKKTFAVHNPFDNSLVANVADCGPEEAKEALESALAAFKTWRTTNGFDRGTIMKRWADLIRAQELELGRTMALEMGKPIFESRGEAIYTATAIEWYAEEAARIAGEIVPSRYAHKRGIAHPEPVGVVYGITPWNFPAAMIARKVGPALAAGCAFILKPAEQSPLTALYLAKLWDEAGGPKGTFQVLPASDPIPVSKVLIDDERVRKLTFTGSTAVGRLLYEQSARTLKRVSLELGGHAPFILFEDTDVQQAASIVAISKFRNAGQTCISSNRIFAHEKILGAFNEAFVAEVKKLKHGDPLLETTTLGPLVDAQGLEKVKSHVDNAVALGAKVSSGGEALGGLFYAATVLTDVPHNARILEEETFGPVAPIVGFTDEAQVLEAANSTQYGLAAYIWTRDISRAFRVAEALEYGIVGVNDGVPSAMAPQAPFGGIKNSGVGREGGRWGLEAFQETKFISISLPS